MLYSCSSFYLQRWKVITHVARLVCRCLLASTCSISALSGVTPTPTLNHTNPATTPRVWPVLLQHVALSHVCFLWQMEIKWALEHAGATVCLCFAPLEISMHALCVLQRDDKLKRGNQSWAVRRTKIQTRGIEGVFLQLSLQIRVLVCLGMGAEEKRRKEGKEREGGAVCCHTCVCELCWVGISDTAPPTSKVGS